MYIWMKSAGSLDLGGKRGSKVKYPDLGYILKHIWYDLIMKDTRKREESRTTPVFWSME